MNLGSLGVSPESIYLFGNSFVKIKIVKQNNKKKVGQNDRPIHLNFIIFIACRAI
jgi:hypothetical protein